MNRETPLLPEVWERTPPEAQAYIRALEARIVALEATAQHLEALVQQLREQLQQDSRTSSRPPSSDPPQASAKRPRREPSGRRPGGQPGHEGQTRALVPVEAVDVVHPVKPERFWGILVTDRWSAYTWYPTWWRQLCWAHLWRDIEAMIDRGGRSAELREGLRVQARQMFHWWHRVRDGTLKHSSFRVYMSPVRREVERLLEAGQSCGVPKTEGVSWKILTLREALWTFVRVEGVEPTNNAAERAIRPGVLWRKGSFGTQSAEGSRFVEAMMTVVATLRQQHRHVLDYLTAACEAALCGETAPSLLPTPADIEQLMRPAA